MYAAYILALTVVTLDETWLQMSAYEVLWYVLTPPDVMLALHEEATATP
jgi:hypothetical protein